MKTIEPEDRGRRGHGLISTSELHPPPAVLDYTIRTVITLYCTLEGGVLDVLNPQYSQFPSTAD
jgi:hypothetical protein